MGDPVKEGYEPCRFCNAQTDLLVPIFSGEGVLFQLETKIARHLPIHVSTDDTLPQGVCYPCVDTLLNWDSFVTLCVENDAMFRKKLDPPTKNVEEGNDLTLLSFTDSDDEPLIVKRQKVVLENKDEIKKKYNCDSCGKNYKTKQAFDGHVKTCKDKEYFCSVCNQVYKTHGNLKRHKEREHGSDPVPCPVCKNSFSKQKLNQHLKSAHSVVTVAESLPRFKCKYCQEQFKGQYLRNDHIKQVHDKEIIKCALCEFEGCRVIVKRHTRSVHAAKKYPCSLCNFSFKTLHLLKMHMTAHSDLRSYTCDVCGMSFKRLNNVRDHMKCHQQKSNQCQICGNFFARKRYLAIHEKTIHNFYADGTEPEEKGFECGVCGAKLKWKKNLLAHMRIHTGEKPYECKICGQAFVCHGSLRTHMAKHDVAVTEPVDNFPFQTQFSLLPVLRVNFKDSNNS